MHASVAIITAVYRAARLNGQVLPPVSKRRLFADSVGLDIVFSILKSVYNFLRKKKELRLSKDSNEAERTASTF